MYYYFSAGYPAVIKLNGIYYGEISDPVKFINVQSPSCFVEICPLNSSLPQLNFFLDEELLENPPSPLSVTDMGGGYLIKYSPIIQDNKFSLISQNKFPNSLFTAFKENGYKLSIETNGGVYVENLDFEFSKALFAPFQGSYEYYLAIFYGKETIVNAYCIKGETERVLSFSTTEFDVDNMKAITSFKDMAKHVLTERLIFDGEIKKEKLSLSSKNTLTVYNIHQKLVPYAMLEALYIGDDIKDFLIGLVLENCDRLKDFFGNYIGVMPPPFFRDDKEVGLIYKVKEGKYQVRYFTFLYENKKICGIRSAD